MQQIFSSLPDSYRIGAFMKQTTFYFDIDGVQKSVTLSRYGCAIEDGKAFEKADCNCTISAAMLKKIWNEGYKPGFMDFMTKEITTSAPLLLQKFVAAFGK